MKGSKTLLLVLPLALAAPPAEAIIYGGNPHLTLTVNNQGGNFDAGVVRLDEVRMNKCIGGSNVYVVDEVIDPVDGYGLDIDAGNYCSVTLVWATDMTLHGYDNNNSGFGVDYDKDSTVLGLSGSSQSAALIPFEVVFGVIYGGNPHITVAID